MSEVGIQERSTNPVEGAKPKERHSVRISETATERKTRTMPSESSFMSDRGMSISGSSTTPRSASLKGMASREKDRKIGHRRVDEAGQVTYKKRPTSELMNAIQLGIGQSVGSLSSKPERDLLLQDFGVVENVVYPSEGSNLTPAHHCSDFRFKTYAPIAFRYFRELFGIQPDDFLLSMCNDPLRELSNPGASGSIFYITNDDEFIIKTVQHKEAEFLQKLLPGYYMNLNQNPRTLLPKFYGLYCYQCGGKNIRFIAMNNLLPSSIVMHEKYDLKGSTYKRKASKRERAKAHPTLKDLDFRENHPDGIYLEADTYSALTKTLERDCRVLQSFKIMDYSLLMGVHNLDQNQKMQEENGEGSSAPGGIGGTVETGGHMPARHGHPHHPHRTPLQAQLSRGRSQKQRIANYSTALESIQAKAEPVDMEEDVPPGGIPARNSRGERLLLYMGIIDILQSYRLKKKLEHAMKAMVHDGDTISVHRPGFYAQRFQSFFAQSVFKKIPSLQKLPRLPNANSDKALKHSPSKKKGPMTRMKSISVSEAEPSSRETFGERPRSQTQIEEAAGAVGGRPDLLPDHNIPAVSLEQLPDREVLERVHSALHRQPAEEHDDVVDQKDSRLHMVETRSQTEARVYTSRSSGGDQHSLSSPVPSISESTPTHTEYTEDSGIASEQIELQVTSERTAKRTLLPAGSPSRHIEKREDVVREDLASPSSSGSPTTRATSGETSFASIVNSQTTIASSSADDYVSPEEEMR